MFLPLPHPHFGGREPAYAYDTASGFREGATLRPTSGSTFDTSSAKCGSSRTHTLTGGPRRSPRRARADAVSRDDSGRLLKASSGRRGGWGWALSS
eukprot:scaffold46615_cov31-Tisochrysis_lutea.AAC.1